MAENNVFTWPDYLLFASAIIISLSIGIYQMLKRRKENDLTASELLVADRKMNILPVSLSMTASLVSGILILGVPHEVVKYGGVYYLTGLSYLLNYAFCAHCVVPVFYRLRLCSGYQYLELRFHKYVRRIASLTFVLQTIFYMSVVIYAPAITISQTTGMPTSVAIALTGIVCTLYTAIGGLRAVIWTDVFQIIVMITSLIVTVVIGIQNAGGTSEVSRIISEGDRWPYFDFDPDPRLIYSFWSCVLGSTFSGMASFSFQQMIIQRFVSLPTKKAAIASVYIAMPVSLLILTLLCVTGLIIYANYADCDPIRIIHSYNKILPHFITQALGKYSGLPGLFVSCIFCGALSTISSGINSLAAVTYYDFVDPLYLKMRKEPIGSKTSGKITIAIALIFGSLAVLFSYVIHHLNPNILHTTLIILNTIAGPITGMFVLGLFVPWANTKGTLVGFSAAVIMTLWLGIGNAVTNSKLKEHHLPNNSTNVTECTPIPPVDRNLYKNRTGWDGFYSISYLWFAFIAVAIVLILGNVVSLITGGTTSKKKKYTIWKYKKIPIPPRST
ncbi:sodium-dependent multivitamin transporter [Octopus bimaculoides]|uniref:sodium-dependent multivitamin transporter n=1 Tax=Octopus bimaculoides TaxID=37653 RepID=UPI0022E5E853|nr:sodium-dependent multivitamin transporter [Octopus bimaculoides]